MFNVTLAPSLHPERVSSCAVAEHEFADSFLWTSFLCRFGRGWDEEGDLKTIAGGLPQRSASENRSNNLGIILACMRLKTVRDVHISLNVRPVVSNDFLLPLL